MLFSWLEYFILYVKVKHWIPLLGSFHCSRKHLDTPYKLLPICVPSTCYYRLDYVAPVVVKYQFRSLPLIAAALVIDVFSGFQENFPSLASVPYPSWINVVIFILAGIPSMVTPLYAICRLIFVRCRNKNQPASSQTMSQLPSNIWHHTFQIKICCFSMLQFT